MKKHDKSVHKDVGQNVQIARLEIQALTSRYW